MKSLRKIRGDGTGIEQLVKWVGVVGIVGSLGLLYVWQQIQTRDLKLDILNLEARKVLIIKDNSRLQVLVSHFSDNEAVESKANEMFALNYPAIGQVVAMDMIDQYTIMANAPVDNGIETGKKSRVMLPMASVSISQLNRER